MLSEKYSKEKKNLQINLKLDEVDLLLVVTLVLFILKLLCVYCGPQQTSHHVTAIRN